MCRFGLVVCPPWWRLIAAARFHVGVAARPTIRPRRTPRVRGRGYAARPCRRDPRGTLRAGRTVVDGAAFGSMPTANSADHGTLPIAVAAARIRRALGTAGLHFRTGNRIPPSPGLIVGPVFGRTRWR